MKQFGHTQQLISGYFHQDWDIDGSTDEAVIAFFISNETCQHVYDVIADLEDFVAQCDAEKVSADSFLQENGCAYHYQADGLSGIAWLKRILSFLKSPSAHNEMS